MGFYVPIMWVEKSPFGAVLGPFSLFSRSPSPHVRRFGLGVPGNGIRGVFVSAALEILPSMTSIRRIWHLFASFTWD